MCMKALRCSGRWQTKESGESSANRKARTKKGTSEDWCWKWKKKPRDAQKSVTECMTWEAYDVTWKRKEYEVDKLKRFLLADDSTDSWLKINKRKNYIRLFECYTKGFTVRKGFSPFEVGHTVVFCPVVLRITWLKLKNGWSILHALESLSFA